MKDTLSRRTGHHELFDTVHRLIVHLKQNRIVSGDSPAAHIRSTYVSVYMLLSVLEGDRGLSCASRPKLFTYSLQVLLEEILIVAIATRTETNL